MDVCAAPIGRAVVAAPADRLVRLFVGNLLMIDAAFVGLFLLMLTLGREVDTLSVAAERSIPTWYAAAKLLLVAQVLGGAAFAAPPRERAVRGILISLAVLFAVLSVDEIASLHERFGWKLNAWLAGNSSQEHFLFARTGYWMVVLLPPTLAALVLLGRAYARLSRPARATVGKALVGCGLFLGGAAGIEALQNFLTDGPVLGVAIAAEEGSEFAGVTFLLWSALDEFARHARRSSSP